ncbi:assimilatory sulfite reductase (NADPH) flavoprotein subunit [Parabacteroides sp. FAFU027]|uniref:assimilatory sulfite reductase (NADPH) flavoprotein subunit n=1 Tax=Parabacteroides sp. FAFU027 TaxID=2922715 RepID=UPI001FAF1CD2|nr:assimilatory sulfite reductase (NADPH) flavoprotein subunit [Parabacteroides sp. FAFU027]
MNNLTTPLSAEQAQQLSQLIAHLSREQTYWVSGYFAGLLAQKPAIAAQPSPEISAVIAPEVVAEAIPAKAKVLTILYGSRTGNGEALAKLAQKMAVESGFEVSLKSMENYKAREIKDEKNLLVIVSTHGDGEPPFQAKEFYEFIHSKRAPQLNNTQFAVIGLGDRSYLKFCQVGVDLDKRLAELGAKRINDRTDCDVDFRGEGMRAISKLLSVLEKESGSATQNISVVQTAVATEEHEEHNRLNPFQATVLDKTFLHGRDSDRQTLHVELSLEGSGITYEPGDSMGVYATNPPELVDQVLETLQLNPNDKITTERGETTLSDALYKEVELTTLTPDVLNRFATTTDNAELKGILTDPAELKKFIHGKDIVDLFTHYPEKFNPEQLLGLLRKIQPRLYSISSSPLAHPDEAHLTVGVVKYNNKGRNKTGLCSVFLSDRVYEEETAPAFIEKNPNFRLPINPQTPIIMVGAGTGIAPYRAFVEHRAEQDNAGKSWLFFGNRFSESEFLYQLEWQRFLKEKTLTKMSVAFSRDSEQKVYVQDRLLENSREVFDWLENGGHFYVCGDMKKMAGDVNHALIKIIEKEGGYKHDLALEYINNLQREKRYQTDVY